MPANPAAFLDKVTGVYPLKLEQRPLFTEALHTADNPHLKVA